MLKKNRIYFLRRFAQQYISLSNVSYCSLLPRTMTLMILPKLMGCLLQARPKKYNLSQSPGITRKSNDIIHLTLNIQK